MTVRALRLPHSDRARWWLLAGALVLLALASSAVGIRNGFVYDDVYVVQKNDALHSLHRWWTLFAQSYWPKSWGGDGYRPVTMLLFAIEWAVGRGAPWVFHAVNVALYCATTVAMFWVASALLPTSAAWLATALFAVHPVHVEAVANTVGQSELTVALLLTVATGIYLHRRAAPSASTGALLSRASMTCIALCYAVALFAKEHAIVLPALLLAAEVTVVSDDRPLRARLRALRPFMLVLTLVAVCYLGARALVKDGEISGFQPFIVFQALGMSYSNRVLTMLGAVPEWVRLLLWPARLSTEYAPPYVSVAQGAAAWQLPGLLILLGVLGLGVGLARRGRPASVVSFGIAWLCVTLLPSSNFVIPAGIILAERTLFLPSLGAMLALGAVVPFLSRSATKRIAPARARAILAIAVVGAILVAGTWRSSTRTRVWRDNDTLFNQAVLDVPESYRAHYMLGAWRFEQGRKKEGELHYRRAIHLFPYDPFMSYNLAQQYQFAGMFQAAIPMYRWSFEIAPTFREGQGRANLALCLIDARQYDEAREQALIGMRLGGAPLRRMRRIVQMADSGKANSAASARSKRPRIAHSTVSKRDGKVPETVQITGVITRPPGHAAPATR